MHISIQKTVVVFEGQSFSVRTERDIGGQEAGWAIEGVGWICSKMIMAGSVYEATRAGVEAVLRLVGRPVIGIRSEVSCEMLSISQVEKLIAELGDGIPIDEF